MTNKPMLSVERDVIESAFECLERCQEQAFQSCECEMCLECGKMPDGCSGTECAKTCQCSTCEHCCNEQAIKELRALLDKSSTCAESQVEPAAWERDMDYRPEELGSPETEPAAERPREPVECRCRRYGKDNPHWPC